MHVLVRGQRTNVHTKIGPQYIELEPHEQRDKR